MITEEQIREAFATTCAYTNGGNCDNILKGKCSAYDTVIGATYYIIERLYEGSPWRVMLLDADGGIRNFILIYKCEGFDIIVDGFSWKSTAPFEQGAVGLADYLNQKEKEIVLNMETFCSKNKITVVTGG